MQRRPATVHGGVRTRGDGQAALSARCALHRVGTRLFGAASLLSASGCPQLLSDEFEPLEAGGAGGVTAQHGGASSRGGAPHDGGVGTSGAAGDDEGHSGGGGTGWGHGGSSGAPHSCSDGMKSPGEVGVDCGGECSPCDCTWSAFGALQRLSGLGLSSSAWGPNLSFDGLTLTFSSGDPEDVFTATRVQRGGAFSAASALPGNVNTASAEGTVFASFDGLRLYFYRSGAGGDRDIFFATRSDTSSMFHDGGPVPGLNSPSSDHLPWVSRDELRIYFSSSRAGGRGGYDLWLATRAHPGGAFEMARPLAELNTAQDDEGASLTLDELTVFFASERAGSSDIWMATRSERDAPFSAPVRVLELSTPDSELNPAISADGSELFFSTNRAGPLQELWRATRSCD